MSTAAIKTTHKSAKYQTAEVTLADGRTYQIHGERVRVGRQGWGRSYTWKFSATGEGLAHVAVPAQRELGRNWKLGGAEFSALNSVALASSTMTDAKRSLASLLTKLAA